MSATSMQSTQQPAASQKAGTQLANRDSEGPLGLFRDPFFDALGFGLPSFGFAGLPQSMQLVERAASTMQLDVKESDASFEVQADVPGIDKGDVKVELDKHNVLHVSINKATADTKDETTPGGWTVHRVERSRVTGHRAVRLPNTIDGERVTARVANGVLTVTVPKAAPHTHDRRRIAVA